MSELKLVKKKLQAHQKWKQYKKLFAHPQMRLLITKIAYDIRPEHLASGIEQVARIEESLIDAEKNEEMFATAFLKLGSFLQRPWAWDILGRAVWYCYQTSTYWKDVKKDIPNIYNKENFVQLNDLKRKAIQHWIHSIPRTTVDFNIIVTNMLKRIL